MAACFFLDILSATCFRFVDCVGSGLACSAVGLLRQNKTHVFGGGGRQELVLFSGPRCADGRPGEMFQRLLVKFEFPQIWQVRLASMVGVLAHRWQWNLQFFNQRIRNSECAAKLSATGKNVQELPGGGGNWAVFRTPDVRQEVTKAGWFVCRCFGQDKFGPREKVGNGASFRELEVSRAELRGSHGDIANLAFGRPAPCVYMPTGTFASSGLHGEHAF